MARKITGDPYWLADTLTPPRIGIEINVRLTFDSCLIRQVIRRQKKEGVGSGIFPCFTRNELFRDVLPVNYLFHRWVLFGRVQWTPCRTSNGWSIWHFTFSLSCLKGMKLRQFVPPSITWNDTTNSRPNPTWVVREKKAGKCSSRPPEHFPWGPGEI